jgi:hypothetical protein
MTSGVTPLYITYVLEFIHVIGVAIFRAESKNVCSALMSPNRHRL